MTLAHVAEGAALVLAVAALLWAALRVVLSAVASRHASPIPVAEILPRQVAASPEAAVPVPAPRPRGERLAPEPDGRSGR